MKMKKGDHIDVLAPNGKTTKKAIIEKSVTRKVNGRKCKGYKVRYANGTSEEVHHTLCSKRHDNPTGVLLASLTGSKKDAGRKVYYQNKAPNKTAILTYAGRKYGNLGKGSHVEWDFSLRQYVKVTSAGNRNALGKPKKGQKNAAFNAAMRSLQISQANVNAASKEMKEQTYDLTSSELDQIYAVAPELKTGKGKAAPKKKSNVKSIRTALQILEDNVGKVSDAKFKKAIDLVDQATAYGHNVSIADVKRALGLGTAAKKSTAKKPAPKKSTAKKPKPKKSTAKKSTTKKSTSKKTAAKAALGEEVASIAQARSMPAEAVDAAAAAGAAAVRSGASAKTVKAVAKAAAKNAKQEVEQEAAASGQDPVLAALMSAIGSAQG